MGHPPRIILKPSVTKTYSVGSKYNTKPPHAKCCQTIQAFWMYYVLENQVMFGRDNQIFLRDVVLTEKKNSNFHIHEKKVHINGLDFAKNLNSACCWPANKSWITSLHLHEALCAIWYHFCNLKSTKPATLLKVKLLHECF